MIGRFGSMASALAVLLAFTLAATDVAGQPRPAGVPIKAFNLHFAAGFMNGHRPSRIKALLGASWHRSWFRLRRAVHKAVKQGYVALITVDANDRHFPVGKLHPTALVLEQEGPDFIIAVPPTGIRVRRVAAENIHTFIEQIHDCLWVRLRIVTPDGVASGVIGFFNSGRAPSATDVQRSYDAMVTHLPSDTVQIAFVEIGEGDKPTYSEMDMIAKTWSQARWRHLLLRKRHTMEPILLRRDLTVTDKVTTEVVAGGVPHQSPVRRINAVGYLLPYDTKVS